MKNWSTEKFHQKLKQNHDWEQVLEKFSSKNKTWVYLCILLWYFVNRVKERYIDKRDTIMFCSGMQFIFFMPTSMLLLSWRLFVICGELWYKSGAKPLKDILQGPIMSANPCMTFRAFMQLSPPSDVACAGGILLIPSISKWLCISKG